MIPDGRSLVPGSVAAAARFPSPVGMWPDRHPSRAGTARRVGRAWLQHGCGMADHRLGPAVLMLSELVSNAIVHGTGDDVGFHAWLATDGCAWIAVDDRTPSAVPQPHQADDDAEHGRGLWLVEAYANELGGEYGHSADGTVAWLRIPLRESAGPAHHRDGRPAVRMPRPGPSGGARPRQEAAAAAPPSNAARAAPTSQRNPQPLGAHRREGESP